MRLPLCTAGDCLPLCAAGLRDDVRLEAALHTDELRAPAAGSSPLSPVVKSIVMDSEPAAPHLRGRVGLMRRIESRFRFLAVRSFYVFENHGCSCCLGQVFVTLLEDDIVSLNLRLQADATATLRGQRPSYRESLLSVRQRLEVRANQASPLFSPCVLLHYMSNASETGQVLEHQTKTLSVSWPQVPCPSTLATQDLEAEIFLHMMQMYAESTAEASKEEADALVNACAVNSDGMAPPRYVSGCRHSCQE